MSYNDLVFIVVNVFKIFSYFFAIYLVGYSTFLLLSVLVGSTELYDSKRTKILHGDLYDDVEVPVSIITPAHNEDVTIVSTLHSLLKLEYNLYEIIVVDDGSTDDTSQRVIDEFNLVKINRPIRKKLKCQPEVAVYESTIYKVPITLIIKENGGKADTLNMGINASNYPYFICMDADSLLQRDSLHRIVEPVLEYDDVVAVGGAIRPNNGCIIEDGIIKEYHMPKRVIPAMQALEYDRTFLAARMLFDKYNGNLIISGAYGLFKKDSVIAVGGYDADTMGEDMELVVKLHVYHREHGIPYHIKYAFNAICWTQVPEKLKDLRNQRRRWHIGLFQSMTTHRQILGNVKYGLVGSISYIYFLIYELLSPYIEIFGILIMLIAFYFEILNWRYSLYFMGIYALFTSLLSLTSFFSRSQTIDLNISVKDVLKACSLCLFEITILRLVLAWTRMTALIGYKKKKKSWGVIERHDVETEV